MMSTSQSEPKEQVLQYLDEQIKFQHKWQRFCMSLYWITTVGSVVFGFTATILGALNYGLHASFFAGFATVMITVEKSLLFREKWRLHLHTITALRNQRIDLMADQVDVSKAIERLKETLEQYATDLPIEARK